MKDIRDWSQSQDIATLVSREAREYYMKVRTLAWALNTLLLLEEVEEDVLVNVELITDEDAIVFRCVNGNVTVEELEESAYSDWFEGAVSETASSDSTGIGSGGSGGNIEHAG